MKKIKNYLVYIGRCTNPACPEPYKYLPVHATIEEADLYKECPVCHGTVDWELEHHHIPQPKQNAPTKAHKNNKLLQWIIIATITLLALAGSAAFCYALRHKSYTADQMSAAQAQIAGKTVSEVLTQLQEDSSDAAIGHLLHASPFTIERLRKNETQPTPAMAAQVYGLACQWHLNHKSWLLTRLQLYHKTDLFYAFPDTAREVPN